MSEFNEKETNRNVARRLSNIEPKLPLNQPSIGGFIDGASSPKSVFASDFSNDLPTLTDINNGDFALSFTLLTVKQFLSLSPNNRVIFFEHILSALSKEGEDSLSIILQSLKSKEWMILYNTMIKVDNGG